MESEVKDIKISFDRENQLVPQYTYHNWHGKAADTGYYHNVVFEDEFEIDKFYSSRSSVYITIRSTMTRVKYFMRWWAMKDLLTNGTIDKGKFKGIFTFTHKWDYTTVALFDPTKLKDETLAGPDWWNYAQPWGMPIG